jgi:hypothetical protein
MMTRTTRKTVVFLHPFTLKGVERTLPPGKYQTVTDEEMIGGLSFPVYRRISTVIFVPAQSRTIEMVTIDPLDLQAAQQGDAATLSPASRSIRSSDANRPLRHGAPSCVIMRRPPWTCSLPRPLTSTCSMSSSSFDWSAETSSGSTSGLRSRSRGTLLRGFISDSFDKFPHKAVIGPAKLIPKPRTAACSARVAIWWACR